MSTRLDNMMKSKNVVLFFGGVVSMAAAYTIWGNDGQGMFPPQPDPTGDPKTWTKEECRLWLEKASERNLHPDPKATKEELLERVIANMRIPRK
ncbi:STE24 endopeptidase [Fusarium austroafricanum]|uniref:STE24 endopeptidase n=1 Tax=Fusarium austroafricanum TaxID=2364996 RepID=A0A8H4KNU2_9HYPO|nr:STE24 endopeptidase [Fusarium austroafricanum]